jgi:hypothetical protein
VARRGRVPPLRLWLGASGRVASVSAGVPRVAGAGRSRYKEVLVIILGVILLIIGFVAKIAILWTIGIIVTLIGLIFALFGAAGRMIGPRRHYW